MDVDFFRIEKLSWQKHILLKIYLRGIVWTEICWETAREEKYKEIREPGFAKNLATEEKYDRDSKEDTENLPQRVNI